MDFHFRLRISLVLSLKKKKNFTYLLLFGSAGSSLLLGLLIVEASLVKHSSCGLWALEHRVSSCGLVAPWHVVSSQTRDQTRVSCIVRQILYH